MSAHTETPWEQMGGMIWSPAARANICRMSELRATDLVQFTEPEIGSPTMPEIYANAAFIVRAVNCHDELVAALRAIANVAGNLPDEQLSSRTGPNDAVARGLQLVQARAIARAALAKAENREP